MINLFQKKNRCWPLSKINFSFYFKVLFFKFQTARIRKSNGFEVILKSRRSQNKNWSVKGKRWGLEARDLYRKLSPSSAVAGFLIWSKKILNIKQDSLGRLFAYNDCSDNIDEHLIVWFSKHRPSGPMISVSWNVRLSVHFWSTA